MGRELSRFVEKRCCSVPVVFVEAKSALDLDVALDPVGFRPGVQGFEHADFGCGRDGEDGPIAAVDYFLVDDFCRSPAFFLKLPLYSCNFSKM